MLVRNKSAPGAGKVLIVNSDPEIMRILEVNLAHANLEVVLAQNGVEALQMMRRDKSDIVILDQDLLDIENDDFSRHIKELSGNVPVILIGSRSKKRNTIARLDEIAACYIAKPFDPGEVVALVQGYLMHQERTVNIDPLTGLPNRIQVSKEIARLIEKKTPFAVIYITMHDFKAVNRAYGYAQGDRIIRLLADIASEAVRLFGNPTDLAGHFGGDKFLIITSAWKARTLCRRIIADYHRRIKLLYADEHLQIGHAAYKSTLDAKEPTPVMSIHIAVVTNQKRTFRHPLEVLEAASEQIEYLKNSPESNCYFDLKAHGIDPSLPLARLEIAQAYKEGLKALQGVLAWFDFLTGEMHAPLNAMKDCLHSLESIKTGRAQSRNFKILQDNYNHLNRIVTGIAHLAKSADLKTDNAVVEVDVGDILRWVMEQVQELVEKTGIKTDIEIAGDVGRILIDKKSLTQSLLYIVRNEIHASPPESHLHIHLAEKNAEHIGITVTNPSHCTPARTSPALLQRHSGTSPEALINELYPARILLRSLGGELEITSSKGKGTICAVTIPRKWRSSLQQVDSLQLAMEISRKEARDALKNIQRIVTSLVETVPPGLKDAYDRLAGEVQELAVLCNRSLYLADDFNSRLEMQQDRLLQQESEQLATSEAILTICQNITRSMQVKLLFDPESGKRVVKYTLAIAKELKIPDIEQHSLYHAALLKDLALAFSRLDVIEQTAVTSREVAATLKERLNLLWKAVATIPFFIPACNLLLYRYERYDGNGGSFGLKGTDIPLGARILAVADAFDFLTSDRSPRGRTDPVLAVPQIVAESGLSYDPHVVSALLMLRQRNELEFRFMENKGEISRGVTVE